MAANSPPREYPERPLIKMLLSAYENDAWKGASLNWIEETEENAVEVIATRSDGVTLALEHTLIEPFVGEKYDSTVFTEAFVDKIEKNSALVLPERSLDVLVPVGGIPPGYDREEVGEELLTWLKANHAAAPKGESKHVVMVGALSKKGPIPLTITLHSEIIPGLEGNCLLGRSGKPITLDRIVEKAIRRKVPKLARTGADRRILLLQREHISLSESEILSEIKKLVPVVPELAKVDEIWLVDTSNLSSEGWAYFKLFDDGAIVEILRFQNGALQYRRRDRPW
jgi:hypothetical protein